MNNDRNLQKSGCTCSFCECEPSLQTFIHEMVDRFFAKRKLHRAWKSRFLCGDTIPQNWLREHHRLSRLLQFKIDTAVEAIYSKTALMPPPPIKKEAPWDVILVNEALQLLGTEGIPQKYAGGMLLLYLELCEGIFLD